MRSGGGSGGGISALGEELGVKSQCSQRGSRNTRIRRSTSSEQQPEMLGGVDVLVLFSPKPLVWRMMKRVMKMLIWT